MYPDPRGALRAALEQDPRPTAPQGDRLAAVLTPIVESPIPSLVFTERAAGMSRHAGEISFPGGLLDDGEELRAAALREAYEEIGIVPGTVELVGALPPVHTTVSGILVVPFVGVVRDAPAFVVSDAEIAQVLVFPVSALADAERQVEYRLEQGRTWRGWAYDVEGLTVWGATGWMLHSLLEILREETPWMLTK